MCCKCVWFSKCYEEAEIGQLKMAWLLLSPWGCNNTKNTCGIYYAFWAKDKRNLPKSDGPRGSAGDTDSCNKYYHSDMLLKKDIKVIKIYLIVMSNFRIMNIISLGYYNHWCIHEYITLMLQLGKVNSTTLYGLLLGILTYTNISQLIRWFCDWLQEIEIVKVKLLYSSVRK